MWEVFSGSPEASDGRPDPLDRWSRRVIGNLAADRWFDRLPDRPRLEHLGMGLDRASCPAYPRLGELAEYLCNSQGWNPNEFVGYQCQVTYPLWGAQYLLSFEFGNGDTSESVRSPH